MPTTPRPAVDIAAVFPELEPLARTTVRLHPRRSDDVSFGACSMGAPILWPEDEPWPECERDRFVPVLQLTAAAVPELGFPAGTDLFQLLWCPHEHDGDGPRHVVRFRRRDAIERPRASIPRPWLPQDSSVPHACSLQPERVVEYPHWSELPRELLEKIQRWESESVDRQHAYSSRWLPVEDRDVWKASREVREAVLEPSGLYDVCAHLFVCGECVDHPTRALFLFRC